MLLDHLYHNLYAITFRTEVRLYCEDCSELIYKRTYGRYGKAPVPPPIPTPIRGQSWQR